MLRREFLAFEDSKTRFLPHEHAKHLRTSARWGVREVPAGTTPLDIANSISPRLAAASVVARLTPVTIPRDWDRQGGRRSVRSCDVRGGGSSAPRLVDLAAPLTEDVALELLKENGSGRAEGGPALGRARDGDGDPGAVSGDQAGPWPGDGCGVLLRRLPRDAVHAETTWRRSRSKHGRGGRAR